MTSNYLFFCLLGALCFYGDAFKHQLHAREASGQCHLVCSSTPPPTPPPNGGGNPNGTTGPVGGGITDTPTIPSNPDGSITTETPIITVSSGPTYPSCPFTCTSSGTPSQVCTGPSSGSGRHHSHAKSHQGLHHLKSHQKIHGDEHHHEHNRKQGHHEHEHERFAHHRESEKHHI